MNTKIIASKENWIESKAVEQLEKTALLPGMNHTIGMPDLHPGKDSPIGAVFACEGLIYPHLIGNDIGCGMGFWQTNLDMANNKIDKWTKKLNAFDQSPIENLNERLAGAGLSTSLLDKSLGTIGGGNHFAELQQVHTILEPELFYSMNLSKEAVYLLVHSGSRTFGEQVLRAHQAQYGNGALNDELPEALTYLKQHDEAVKWAALNRQIIAEQFMKVLKTTGSKILDICHNCVEKSPLGDLKIEHWLHRKGAAPSDRGAVIIPGSRGTLSYLAIGKGDQSANLATLAHGAGRKWKRADCRVKLEGRYSRESLTRTALGGRVICEDKQLLYEEAPQAYKDIDIVAGDLVKAGLIVVIATFAPIITYKTGASRR